MNRFQSYKGTGSPAAHAPPSKGSALAIGKEGGSASQLPIRRRTPEKVEDYGGRIYVSNVMSHTQWDTSERTIA